MITLRPYQQEAVDKAVEYFHDNSKGGALIVACTGSGKSIIIASVAQKLKGNTVVFCPTKEILLQNYEKMCMYGYKNDVGIFSASVGIKVINKITLATIGTAINQKELFEKFDAIIVDEAQVLNSRQGMYKEFIQHVGPRKILGLTGTPFRMHSFTNMQNGQLCVTAKMLTRTRPRIFNKILHITQMKDMYEQGYLCPLKYVEGTNYNQAEIPLNSTGRDFLQDELMLYNHEHNVVDQVVESIKKYNLKHIIVFCQFIHEAEDLRDKLNAMGIISATVSAKTHPKERTQILNDFKDGKIRVATNCSAIGVGFDFPAIDGIILARPTKSLGMYMQFLGRAMRLHESKKYATIVDICNNYQNFGKVETFQFIETKPGLHRLVSDHGPLTGFDYYNQIDLEKTNYAGLQEKTDFTSDIITFGKHKGTHVTKLPTTYLKWCVKTFDKGKWEKIFTKELTRRSCQS